MKINNHLLHLIPIKISVFLILFSSLHNVSFALMAEVESYDSQTYGTIKSSDNLVYVNKCSRKILKQYEWKNWEGYYRIEATIQPIATIVIKRESDEKYNNDPAPFVSMAIENSAKIGGNILCYVSLQEAPFGLGFESVTFRAYKQFFLSGNKELENYYVERVAKGLPLTLRDSLKRDEQ